MFARVCNDAQTLDIMCVALLVVVAVGARTRMHTQGVAFAMMVVVRLARAIACTRTEAHKDMT